MDTATGIAGTGRSLITHSLQKKVNVNNLGFYALIKNVSDLNFKVNYSNTTED